MKHSVSLRSGLLLAVTCVLLVAQDGTCDAQDPGIRDTCRFEPDTAFWAICTLEDSTIDIGLVAWTDAPELMGISIGFRIGTDIPWPRLRNRVDSLLIVDTFLVDSSVDAYWTSFLRTSLDPDVPGQHLGINGCLLGFITSHYFDPVIPAYTHTRLGTLRIKILDPAMLPRTGFTIEVDSSFIPPSGTFKFSQRTGTGYPPEFTEGHIIILGGDAEGESTQNGIPPMTFALDQNYPNPFNAGTSFAVTLPREVHVSVSIYNLLGQHVATLIDKDLPAGNHRIAWDGRSEDGSPVSTGIYFYRVDAGPFSETKKMLLLK
jgi:hypothetical protein